MTHTPAPWKIRDRGPVMTPEIWTGTIGICKIIDCRKGENEANALLIAAAPELLEACKAALVSINGDEEYYKYKDLFATLEKAIHKAEKGE